MAREGAFKTVVYNSDGDSHVTGFHLPGEILGLDALGSSFHTCDAIALTLADVCEIPLADLERVASHVPGLQHQLLKIIGQSINRDQKHIELLVQAQRRMSAWRCSCTSWPNATSCWDVPETVFMIPMSREDIGSYLGLVIETVSRTLSKMQDDGLIAVNGREVQVLDKASACTTWRTKRLALKNRLNDAPAAERLKPGVCACRAHQQRRQRSQQAGQENQRRDAGLEPFLAGTTPKTANRTS